MQTWLRKASEFRVEIPAQPGQAHRSAAGALIDYRLQEITDAKVRAISTVPGNFVDKPAFASPWHYHDCGMQIAVVLEGSVELGYRADHHARAQKGDVLFIPGHEPHDVGAVSHDYQIAEITFPGTFGTTEAPPPEPGTPMMARTLSTRDAVRVGTESGLTTYRYPVPEPHASTYAITREVRSRTTAFVPRVREHADPYRMTIALEGWKEIELDGQTRRIERGDMLVVPRATLLRELAVSDDWAAVEVALRHE